MNHYNLSLNYLENFIQSQRYSKKENSKAFYTPEALKKYRPNIVSFTDFNLKTKISTRV